MPQFTNKRRVRHAAADMFDLVADVGRYPEFLPWCHAARVRQRDGAALRQMTGITNQEKRQVRQGRDHRVHEHVGALVVAHPLPEAELVPSDTLTLKVSLSSISARSVVGLVN